MGRVLRHRAGMAEQRVCDIPTRACLWRSLWLFLHTATSRSEMERSTMGRVLRHQDGMAEQREYIPQHKLTGILPGKVSRDRKRQEPVLS